MKVIEFPPGVRTGSPFDSAAAGVLWWRQAADGDHGDQAQQLTRMWQHQAPVGPPLTLAPIYGPHRPVNYLTVTRTDDYPTYVASDNSDPRLLIQDYYNAATTSTPTVGLYVPDDLDAQNWFVTNGPVCCLGLYRIAAGQEFAQRQVFLATPKTEKPPAAKALQEYESATTTADLVLTRALNSAVTDLWHQLLNAGTPVFPDPNAPGATAPGYSPAGTVRPGLTS